MKRRKNNMICLEALEISFEGNDDDSLDDQLDLKTYFLSSDELQGSHQDELILKIYLEVLVDDDSINKKQKRNQNLLILKKYMKYQCLI
jgi:hypothetical protein